MIAAEAAAPRRVRGCDELLVRSMSLP